MPRKPISWKIAGKLMPTAPDADGEIFLTVEIDVESGFPGLKRRGHPTVSFSAGTKSELWVDASSGVDPPVYRYTVEVTFRTGQKFDPGTHLVVARCWDREGSFCRKDTRDDKYWAAPQEERLLANPLEEGIWQAIILGEVRDAVGVYEETWRYLAPFLLQMSKAPEMRKMEELYLGAHVAHEELHTDVGGYDEARPEPPKELIEKDSKAIAKFLSRPLLAMPPPEKIKLKPSSPVEHFELHTDTSDSEYDG